MILDDLRELERSKRVLLQYFTYSTQFPAATFLAGATITNNVSIQNDSDFLWRYTMLTSYSAAGVFVPAPDMLISFSDTGSGRNLQDIPNHVGNVTGTAQLPYVLPEPFLITAGSILNVTLTNNAAGPAALVSVSLGGFKVFHLQGYQR